MILSIKGHVAVLAQPWLFSENCKFLKYWIAYESA